MVGKESKARHTYRVNFNVSVKDYLTLVTGEYHHPLEMQMITAGLEVYDETENGQLVYSESPQNHPRNNIIHYKSLWEDAKTYNYYSYNRQEVYTEIFDGIRLKLDMALSQIDTAYFDVANSGWAPGHSDMNIRHRDCRFIFSLGL